MFATRCYTSKLNFVQSVAVANNFKSFIGYVVHKPVKILHSRASMHCRQFYSQRKTLKQTWIMSKTGCNHEFRTPDRYWLGLVSVNARNMKSAGSVSVEPQGIHENISALQMKTRLQRRKRQIIEEEDSKKHGYWNVAAYATAEEYNLEAMVKGLLEQNLYVPVPQQKNIADRNQSVSDFLHMTARYQVGAEPREIYFFREGTAIFWNIPELETSDVLTFIRQFEENSYDERLVLDESEIMPYTHTVGKKSHLQEGAIIVGDEGNTELDKYTFANVMSLTVKLGIWEASLNRYVDSIEYVTEDLKQGKRIKISREEVLRKTGELFALRHVINLSSDLLDTPDFYWDHEEQENLYQQLCSYFSINRRTRVMNEKINHCVELVELLSTHLSDKHHTRLEWMIIILIMVEVGFEIIHYADRFL